MPLMLLAGAALEPSALLEAALICLGAAALALTTVRLAAGWWAMAVACAITVIAYAIDALAGSELTKLCLLGPNPIYGARFYGIGNELEALFAVMVPAGVGVALTALAASGKPPTDQASTAAFSAAAVLAAIVFAAGRFGADVGAAIVLPVGGAGAVAALRGARERGRIAVVIAAPIAALAALAMIDLLSGANAHLTRSVLDAGGVGDLADVADRRLRLSADDFGDAASNPLFWLVVAGIALACIRPREIERWLAATPFARAGLIGAAASVAVAVLVNDSGATVLTLGSLALGAFLAFVWSQYARTESTQIARNAITRP
jgi:hypothetical protein